MMKYSFSRFCLGFTVCVFSAVSGAWALTVTPSRTEVRLTPGHETKTALEVVNEDKVEIQVDVSKKNWFIPPENKAATVETWLTVHGPARFYLKPGEKRKVDLTIKSPKDLTGEVVGMVSFLYQTEQPSNVTPMISVSMYLIAAGTEKLSGEITEILVRKWNDQINVSAHVKATGNMHLRPSGELTILDDKGFEMAHMPVAEGQPTYPGTENAYFGTTPPGTKLVPGHYRVKVQLASGDLKLEKTKDFTITADGQVESK
jgi:hypothetical protein